MSGPDPQPPAGLARRDPAAARIPLRRRTADPVQRFGTITIVGGGCYGSYYVRQLGRAREASAIAGDRLVVVDRDPRCRAALEAPAAAPEVVVSPWADYFDDYFGEMAEAPDVATRDALVPSPLMPHLLFDWLVTRARKRYPRRCVEVRPLATTPATPWQRASPNGETHYVSFAEWMCPINCIEPQRCPATRGLRTWTMPEALRAHVLAEKAAGHNIEGPLVFHCEHRAFGVGMIDVQDVIAADRRIAIGADAGEASFLVGTVSHCHGALGVVSVGT